MDRQTLSKKRQYGDLLFLFGVTALAAYGLVCVYSASSYNAQVQYGDAFFFFKKQLVGFILGLGAMIGISFLPYGKLRRMGIPALVVSLILLALVFVPGLGKSNYGATRWIGFGSFTIQPSELAKYGFVLFTAGYFAKDPARMRSLKGILPVLGAGLGICVLIILEPNMSVTMCVGALMLGMIFLSGVSKKSLIVICVPVLFVVPALILAEPYRLQRLSAFMNPWASPKEEGYQLIQSLYALGNGNLFGVGLFHSRQKYRFLPFAESDFILSVIGEETGLVGVVIIMSLFVVIAVRGVKIAKQASDRYSCYLAIGITAVTTVQALLNAAVVCGAIPPTGLPLPFVSAGGSSLVAYLGAMGILQSIARNRLPFARINTFEANEARAEGIKHAKRKFSIR